MHSILPILNPSMWSLLFNWTPSYSHFNIPSERYPLNKQKTILQSTDAKKFISMVNLPKMIISVLHGILRNRINWSSPPIILKYPTFGDTSGQNSFNIYVRSKKKKTYITAEATTTKPSTSLPSFFGIIMATYPVEMLQFMSQSYSASARHCPTDPPYHSKKRPLYHPSRIPQPRTGNID